jgi:beta-glucanase (GH16 family)
MYLKNRNLHDGMQRFARVAVMASIAAALLLVPPTARGADTPGWDLVWNDEFEGTTVDAAKWTKEVTNNPANNELQAYTAGQVTVSAGNMVITSENIPTNGKQYRSGRVHSNFTKQFGRWEVRADLPTSRGMWPAIWLLPNTQQHNWPSQGEIDIMENRGNQPNLTSSAFHYGTNPPYNHQFRFAEQTAARFGAPVNFHDGFHTFAVEWDETKLRFFVDDVHHWTLFNSDVDGFVGNQSAPMWTMLNTAVGGDFLPPPDGTTVWPQKFLIDYVRILDRNDDPIRFRNGGFEQNDGSLAGWSVFGNRINTNNVSVHDQAVNDGDAALKLFGQSSGTNYSGVSQGITVAAGDPVEVDATSFIRSQDSITGTGNTVQMKIEFYNEFGGKYGTSAMLDEITTTIATSSSPNDVWRAHEMSAVAPAGAVEARLAFVFTQPGAGNAGAIHIDEVSFKNLSLPDVADATGDGVVDGADFLKWQQKLGTPNPAGPTDGDFNFDGDVDAADLDVWKDQSGGGSRAEEAEQGAALQVPEPSAAMLTLTTLAGMLKLRPGSTSGPSFPKSAA